MASRAIYSVIAVVGIAGASGAAYWFQNKPAGPTEIPAAVSGTSAAGVSVLGARGTGITGGPGGAGGAGGPGGPAGVEVAKVEVAKLQDDAQSVGSMRSRQNVMLRPEVAGRIMSMGFTDGGRVRKGDVLVQLDDVLQRAEVRQSEASMSIVRANLKRNQELVAQNFVAQRVLDESSAALQVAEAQVALSCARWERMRMLAPFDGTAGIRNINIGDYVKDGADLVNIEDLSSMYVDFKLPERFQGKLRKDQQVDLQLDAMPGRQFKARIEAIDPQIDANGRSISVRAVLPNTAGEPLAQRAAPTPGQGASAARGAASATAKPALAAAARAAAKPAQRAGTSVADGGARPADATASACTPYSVARRGAGAGLGAVSGTGSGAGGGKPPVAAGGRPGAGGGAGSGGGPLRPGMFARVTTVFNINENSLTVPEEALVPQGGRQFVIKVVQQTEEQAKALAQAAQALAAASAPAAVPPLPTAPLTGFVDGKRLVSQRTEVKIGIRRPGRVELTDGVAEGDTVVIAGQQRLQRDNSPVRIVDLGRPAGLGGAAPSNTAGAAPASAAPLPAPLPASPSASASR